MFNIFDIFPTPIFMSDICRDITLKEKDFFAKCAENTVPNVGNNLLSKDRYVLRNPECADIAKFITDNLSIYMQEIVRPKYDVDFVITQSWLNWTRAGQLHHKHAHPNSIVSGVFYIDAINDSINFFREDFIPLKIPPSSNNPFNAVTWPFSVSTGTLLIFPSNMLHSVPLKTDGNVRLSLAFNTFAKGTLGSYEESTELIVP